MRIKIKGKDCPVYVTMGAMLKYRDLTGRDIGEGETGTAELVKYMYCCAVSAGHREGIELPVGSPEEFADHLLPADFVAWAEGINSGTGGDEGTDKKK